MGRGFWLFDKLVCATYRLPYIAMESQKLGLVLTVYCLAIFLYLVSVKIATIHPQKVATNC